MSVEVKGAEELRERLRRLAITHKDAAIAALHQEGLALQAAAVRLTPVDTGRLRASAYTQPPEEVGGDVKIRVGFGAEYALPVHEMTENHHTTGQAKFLSQPLHDRSADFRERMIKRIKANLAGGGE